MQLQKLETVNTNNCTGNENQFRLFEQKAGVFYGQNDNFFNPECSPDCYDQSALPVSPINCQQQNFTKSTDCPNLANDDGTALPNRIATLTGDIDTIYTLFDGNNAPALIALINAMANVTTVKNTLLGYSPFVSDEALIELINKATTFGTQNLIDVLIANSKLQPDVQSKINTLTTALKNQINTAIASAQTAPAASEAYHQQLRAKFNNAIYSKDFCEANI